MKTMTLIYTCDNCRRIIDSADCNVVWLAVKDQADQHYCGKQCLWRAVCEYADKVGWVR